ncbi:YiiX/YebB-like N1pC/P60 family cysteine hydrolase [Staphylococcus epidermidis]
MKKLIIGLLCTTVCGTVLTTGSFNAQAESSTHSESLKELQDGGVVSKSITEQEWKQMKAQERKEKAEFEITGEQEWKEQQKQDQMDQEDRKKKKKFHLKKGDYFITNNVSAKCFTGHSAIYLGKVNGKGRVKEAPGYGKPVRVKSFHDWKQNTLKKRKGSPKHRFIKVYRASKKYRGKAGSYARSHFNGVPYSITANPYSKSVTYCSKLVWQSYYYGAGIYSVKGTPGPIFYPYSLNKHIKSKRVRTYKRG